MFHNARRLHSGTNCCCTQKSEGGERKNSHTIRLEKHHVPNRTLLLLLLLRPDGVYNITPGFSVKLNFVFPFSRMGNWSIRLLSFVWVLIGVIIISRTDHAGMRGDVWHFKTTTKKKSQEVLQHSWGVKKSQLYTLCVCRALLQRRCWERDTQKGLLDWTKEHHTHKTCTLMTYRAVGNGGMSNIDECTTYFCVVENKRRRTIIITSTIISLRLECLSFPWVCVHTNIIWKKR
jgi:hypothetical protein